MAGIFDLTEPKHLLGKLQRELRSLAASQSSDAAINAVRDAYHLREWIWRDRLEHNRPLQTTIMGNFGDNSKWNLWVKRQFPDFYIIRDLCNGSKHFEPGTLSIKHMSAGLDGSFGLSDGFNLDEAGSFVQVNQTRTLSVPDLLIRAEKFWADLFSRFPALG